MRRLGFLDLRPGERLPTLLLAASVLTIVASYVMVKAVRDAVFLARFGPTGYAMVLVLVAGVTGVLAALGTRLSHGAPPHRLILGMNGVVAASLVLFWIALRGPSPVTAWLLYLWSTFFGLFVLANFWLLANRIYDIRAAKRSFPLLAAGATLGGVVGGQATSLAKVIGAVNLLPIIAGLFLVAAGLAVAAWRVRPSAIREPEGTTEGRRDAVAAEEQFSLAEGFRAVRDHRYLLLIAGVLFMLTILATALDMQLKAVAKEYYTSDRDQMAAFFGILTMAYSVIALFVQLLITGAFIRRFGVRRALLVMPTAIGLGALVILGHAALAIPMILAVAVAKTLDTGVRFSLDKAAFELLYVPVPAAIKARAKPLIDTVVDRVGTSVAAVLWILLTVFVGEGTNRLVMLVSASSLGLIAIWLALIFRTRAEYVQAFRVSLPGPAVDPHAIPVDLRDRRQLAAVTRALGTDDVRAMLLALDAIASQTEPPARILPSVRPLVGHDSAEVRARALDVLAAARDGGQTLAALRGAADPSPAVRAAAVRLLARIAPTAAEGLAFHPDVRVRLAALTYLAGGSREAAARAAGHIAELLAGPFADEPSLRVDLASAVGALPLAEARPHLAELLLDPDPRVTYAAGLSAARLGYRAAVPTLFARLGNRNLRESALAALRGMSPSIIAELAEALDDEGLPTSVRRQVPALLAAAGTEAAAEALLRVLPSSDPGLRTHAVRALYLWRLRRGGDATLSDRDALERAIAREVYTYATHLEALEGERRSLAGGDANGAGAHLLRRALEEKLEDDMDRLFHLLGLGYPQRDVLAAYYGLRSDQATVRASALELLDNLLQHPLKRTLLALLEGDTAEGRRLAWLRHPNSRGRTRVDTLRALAMDPDPWLRACAIYVVHEAGLAELAGSLAAAMNDDDPRVREVAVLARTPTQARAGAGTTGSRSPEPAPPPAPMEMETRPNAHHP